MPLSRKSSKALPNWLTTVTPLSRLLALSMLIVFPVIGFFLGRYYERAQEYSKQISSPALIIDSSPSPIPTIHNEISITEQEQIEQWIQVNNFNEFGDPRDTAYLGGNPLFDERTGASIDRYEYILKAHPDKPWNK